MNMGKLSQILFDKHKIYNITVGVPPVIQMDENINGMRVSPSIYTSLREIDLFIEAVSYYVKNGLPA
jgi:isopenicillin-N epimerase